MQINMLPRFARSAVLAGLLILFAGGNAYACDACGLFSGVTPMDLTSQAGLYFRYRTFAGLNQSLPEGPGKTLHDPGVSGSDHEDVTDYRENYHRIALNLRWFISRNWNLQASIPFTANNERWPDGGKRGAGISDITLMVNRGLIVKDEFNKAVRVFVGAGVKLPSGWRFRRLEDRVYYFDIQGTTETLDLLFQTDITLRSGNNGLIANAAFRVNTENANGIRYGNFLNVNLNYFRKFDLPALNMRLLPYAGTYLESFAGRFRHQELEYGSGGTLLFANLGLNGFVGKFAFRPEVQIPVAQWLKGRQLKSRAIANMNIDFFF
jgi:hypothetical protein